MNADHGMALLAQLVSQNPEASDDDLERTLRAQGVPGTMAGNLLTFAPIAVSRCLLQGLGIQFAEQFRIQETNELHPLTSVPEYTAAQKIASTLGRESVRALAFRNAEFDAINKAMSNGSQPSDLQMTELIISSFVANTALNSDDPESPIIWDCAASYADTPEQRVRDAARKWAEFSFPVFAELFTANSQFADHYDFGSSGWHAVSGPYLVFGYSDDIASLQQWATNTAVLPAIANSISLPLNPQFPNGIKFVFGSSQSGDTAEVRVNGEVDPAASTALANTPWPRATKASFARLFGLVFQSNS